MLVLSSSPGMGNDLCPVLGGEVIAALQHSETVVPLAGLQDPLKSLVIILVPPPCGTMLCCKSLKSQNFWKQASIALLQRVSL